MSRSRSPVGRCQSPVRLENDLAADTLEQHGHVGFAEWDPLTKNWADHCAWMKKVRVRHQLYMKEGIERMAPGEAPELFLGWVAAYHREKVRGRWVCWPRVRREAALARMRAGDARRHVGYVE